MLVCKSLNCKDIEKESKISDNFSSKMKAKETDLRKKILKMGNID